MQAAKGKGDWQINKGHVVGLALPLEDTCALLLSAVRSGTINSSSHPIMMPCYVFGNLLPIFVVSTPRSLAIAMRASYEYSKGVHRIPQQYGLIALVVVSLTH